MPRRYLFYKFRIKRDKYLLNVYNSRINKVDDLIYEVVDLLNATSNNKRKIFVKLTRRYPKASIFEAIKEAKRLLNNSYEISLKSWEIPYYAFLENKMKKLSVLDFYVADICNLNCRYCNLADKLRFGRKGIMSRMIAQRSLEFLLSNSKEKNLYLRFYGGEPLLNFEIIKYIIESCIKDSKTSGKKYNFTLTTNGTLLSKEIYKFFAKHKVNLGISIDGPPKIHNLMRKFPSGKGSYDLIIKNLKLVRKIDKNYFDKKVKFFSTVVPQNYNLAKTYKYFRKAIGKNKVIFTPVVSTCKYKLSSREFKLLNRIFSKYNDYLFNQLGRKKFDRKNQEMPYSKVINKLLYPKRAFFPCLAGIGTIAVDVDGGIYPCLFFAGNTNYLFGNVTSGIDYKRVFNFFRDYDRATKKCRKCWAVYLCSRPCFLWIAKTEGKFREPKEKLCQSIKKNIKKAIAVYLKIKDSLPKTFGKGQK